MINRIFKKIIPSSKTKRATTNWLCPICLEELRQKDIEWRCVPECQIGSNKHELDIETTSRLVSNSSEQSYPCPTDGCSHTLTQPYVQNCAHPFSEKINRPPNRHHHCIIISLDGTQKGLAAFIYALRLLLPEDYKLYPALPETIKIWGMPELKIGKPKLKSVEPVAIELSSTTNQQEWPLLVYLHPFPRNRKENFTRAIEVKECQFKKSNMIQRIAKAQSIAICINVEDAFSSEGQKKIGDSAKELSDRLRKEGLDLTRTSLWITLANQNVLFNHLEQNEPKIKPLKPTAQKPLDEDILKGYVLHTARLKPFLQPILDLPWRQTRFAMFDAPFDNKKTLMGLFSWVEEIKKDI